MELGLKIEMSYEKFKTVVLILLLSFCSSGSETSEESTIENSSSTSSTTTTSTTSSTSTTTTTLNTDGFPQLEIVEISSDIPEYNRDDWPHWTDYNKDCQDTRQEVLIEESLEPVVYKSDDACSVASGKWYGAYTDQFYYDPSELDIDHLIPLKNAHISGGYQWDKYMKSEFANRLLSPDNLIAVSASANRSKGAKAPDEWKPENKDYWCEYAYDWIRIKYNWFLTVTSSEWEALLEMIETCPEEDIPTKMLKMNTEKKNQSLKK